MNSPHRPAPIDPEADQTRALQATLGRFQAIKAEIQWRAVQRDALVVLTLTFIVGAYVAINQLGAWVMMTPLPLAFVASIWLHHDRRIGFLASYILDVVEPALKRYDGLIGLDAYLNRNDPTRSFTQKYHFSAIMARLLFPGLQLLTLATGLGAYIAKKSFTALSVAMVVAGTALVVAIIIITFVKVKHVRYPQSTPDEDAVR